MSSRKFRVLVFGSSNGVYKDGYVAELSKHPDIESVVNLSLGASSCISATFYESIIDYSDFDFCIIEDSTNESNYVNGDRIKPQTVYNMLVQISSNSARSGCIAIHLMLPPSWYASETSKYYDVANRLHNHCFIPYLDCFKLTKDLQSRSGSAAEWYFKDEVHISTPYGAHVAQIIGDSLSVLWERQAPTRRYYGATPQYKFFDAAAVCVHNEGVSTQYATSLISTNTIELDIGQFAVLDANARSIIGFICNNSMTFSAMKCISFDTRIYSMISGHAGMPRPTVTARPLFDEAPIRHERVILSAMPDSESGITERFDPYSPQRTRDAFGRNGVSIAGLICDTGSFEARHTLFSEEFDISTLIGEDRRNAIISDAINCK